MESGEGPARKYYHLTKGGREYQKRLKDEWFEFVDAVARVLGEYDVWDPKHFKRKVSGEAKEAEAAEKVEAVEEVKDIKKDKDAGKTDGAAHL